MNDFLNALLRSSTDFRFYKEVFPQPFGKTLRYLLALTILVTLLLGLRYSVALNRFSKETLKWIEDNLPYIEIIDGKVKASVEQPYIVSGAEDFVMIIDTTGQTERIDEKYKTGVLLTKDKLIVKQDQIRAQVLDLSKVKSFKLDKTTFGKWRSFFVFVLIPAMIILQFFYFFIAKVVQSALAGLVVLIFKPGVKYSNIMNICVYALSPVTILSLIVILVIPKPIPFFGLIYLGMYIAFIFSGLKQCVQEAVAE